MAQTRQKGIVLALSGPSGSGKTTLARRLVALDERITFSVSATTREPREGETDGVDYIFMTREQFEKDIEAGEFSEHAQVYGEHYYGTPRKLLETNLEKGSDVVLDIDVQGGIQIKENLPGAVLVFIVPPSSEILEQRLRERGTEDSAAIARRLEEVQAELGYAVLYHYLVVNDNLNEALEQLGAIRIAEKARYNRRSKHLPWQI